MVERARAYEGCLDFSISADAVDPERVNLFEGPRGKPREVAVSLYRNDKAEKLF
jgi:hypothetical protein